MRLLLSVAVVVTSLYTLTDQASSSRVKSWDAAERRTYVSQYYSLSERFRNFFEKLRMAWREFFSDLNIGNFGEKVRRLNEQLREALRNLFFS